jgi:hypothetical protein
MKIIQVNNKNGSKPYLLSQNLNLIKKTRRQNCFLRPIEGKFLAAWSFALALISSHYGYKFKQLQLRVVSYQNWFYACGAIYFFYYL